MHPDVKNLLSELRDTFNTKYHLRVKQGAKIPAEDWLAHVDHLIVPLVEATLAVFPERARLVFSELYDVSLELFSVGHFGPDQQLHPLYQLWHEVFPQLLPFIARDPRRVTGSFSNAVLTITQSAPGRVGHWLKALVECGPLSNSTEELLDLGKLAVWRSGLSQYRSAALAIAPKLHIAILRRLFSVADSVSNESVIAWLNSLEQNPWVPKSRSPAATDHVAEVARYGDFQGFGGVFKRPPQVFSAERQLFVYDEESVWQVFADQFGYSFQRTDRFTSPTAGDRSLNPRINSAGTITWKNQEIRRLDLANATSQAFDGTTFAVTVENSFHLFLFSAIPASA